MKGVIDRFSDFEESKSLGRAYLKKFEITSETSEVLDLKSILNSNPLYRCAPGKYVKLYVDMELVMSDTDMEKISNADLVYNARGDVMLAGLGIGLLLHNLKPKVIDGTVRSITVYEQSQDVIDLVSPYYSDIPNLRIIQQDILEYKPPREEKYDTLYFDIWPTIDYEINLPEIRLLHNRWKSHKKDKNSYMNSWMKEHLQKIRKANGRY